MLDLNLANTAHSVYGYDPMRTARTEDELLSLATAMIGTNSRSMLGDADPYWSESAAAVCAGIFSLMRTEWAYTA